MWAHMLQIPMIKEKEQRQQKFFPVLLQLDYKIVVVAFYWEKNETNCRSPLNLRPLMSSAREI